MSHLSIASLSNSNTEEELTTAQDIHNEFTE